MLRPPPSPSSPASVPRLSLWFSPCPNDTFIFHAWAHGLVEHAPAVDVTLADIDELNAAALEGTPDVAKVSFHAFAYLRDRYALLHAGGALGRGCGPLLVARKDSALLAKVVGAGAAEPAPAVVGGADATARASAMLAARVAVPGSLTTAALLFRLFAPDSGDLCVMPFDRIMPAVEAGEVDAGVIIHEGRFTYPAYGLEQVVDLGAWWETTTGHPIPLGGIVVRRDKGSEVASAVDRAIRQSLEAARRDPAASTEYVRAHAQEMDAEVCRQHIDLYVNEFSLDYGPAGEKAIRTLLSAAARMGVAPDTGQVGVYWDDFSV